MLDWILLSILGFFTLILLGYYLFTFTALARYKPTSTGYAPALSVLIAARNELENIKVNLPLILDQDYPNFEVVLINDGSYDGTKDFVEDLQKKYSNLKLVNVILDEKFQRGKKFALTMGIKGASNERLVFTDADCKPSSNKWLSSMMDASTEATIVLGHGPLATRNTILGSLIKYENFHTAIQYFSYALRKKTYMGVGRNLSYTKSMFFENKGFANHQHILSGDDDLFVQEIATPDNVAICVNHKSFMASKGPKGVKTWFNQKKRHLSTSKVYKTKFKFLLGLYSLSQLMFYIALAVNLAFSNLWIYTLAILGLKWLIQWIVFFKPSKLLNYKKAMYFLPYYDVLYTLYLLLFGIFQPFLKVKTWN
jgi:glycosyltransferase involved in cell wall biosynthesis